MAPLTCTAFTASPMPTTLESLSDDLASAVNHVAHGVVAIHARRRIPASGVVWRRGLIVAADHTIHKEEDVRVSLADGGDARAQLVGRDPTTDLCLLRLAEGASVQAATVDAAPLRLGQIVLAVGRPGREATASLGVVSAAGPEWRTWRGGRIDQFIRLDLSIYDGFSGSPVATAAGKVAGLCTSGLARGAAAAVPARTVDRVVDSLLAHGSVTRRGYLGIGTQLVPLPDAIRDQMGPIGGRVPRAGLMIVSVQPGTSAERAGILLGDLLVGLDDDPIEDPRDVFAALGPESVGRTVRATLVRAGKPILLEITIDEHKGRS